MPGGRPSTYDPAYCERVVELGREGKSHAQIAASLDVARNTLYNWADEHPEFLRAITRARDLSQAWFEDRGQSGLETPGFNASLWAKQVSARFPDDYTERQKREVTGKDGGAIETKSDVSIRPQVSREEWLREYVDTAARTAASGD